MEKLCINLSVIRNLPPTSTPDGLSFKRRLGGGGDGEVYSAVRNGETVAIKVVFGEPEKKMRAFQQLVGRLHHHPNILVHNGLQVKDNCSFLEMEFCDTDLLDWVASLPLHSLSESTCHVIFCQLLSAVSHCHSQGVYHGDIKPENILLGKDKQVRLADFDNAIILEPGAPSVIDYTSDCLSQSPVYAAPEFNWSRHVDLAKADIWSMGATLFVIATGHAPRVRKGELESSCKAYEIPNFHFPAHMTVALQDLLMGMLNCDPARRFSMEDIRSHPWITGLSSSAQQHSHHDWDLRRPTIVSV